MLISYNRLTGLLIIGIAFLIIVAIGTAIAADLPASGGGLSTGTRPVPPDNTGGTMPQPPDGSRPLPPEGSTGGEMPQPPDGSGPVPPEGSTVGVVPQPPDGNGALPPGIGARGPMKGKDSSDDQKMGGEQGISFLFSGNITLEPLNSNKLILNPQGSEALIINSSYLSSSGDEVKWLILPVKSTGKKPEVIFSGKTQKTIQSGDTPSYRIYNLSTILSSQKSTDVTIFNPGDEQLEIPAVYLLLMKPEIGLAQSDVSISSWKEEGKFSTTTIPSLQNKTLFNEIDTRLIMPLKGESSESTDSIDITNGEYYWNLKDQKLPYVLNLNGTLSDEEELPFITFESKLKKVYPALLLAIRSERKESVLSPALPPSSETTLPSSDYKEGKDLQVEKTDGILRQNYLSSLGMLPNISQLSGYIYIDSYPSGENILFDGKSQDKGTPLLIGPVNKGRYLVKDSTHEPEQVIIPPGRISFYKFNCFEVPQNNVVDEIKKENKSISQNPLRVESLPEGAEIVIDGTFTGLHTPAEFSNLSTGSHTITLMIPGYFPVRRDIILPIEYPTGTKHIVNLTLNPLITGGLMVSSDPIGAKIYLDGRYTGETTPCTFPFLKLGSYLLSLKVGSEKKNLDVLINPYQVSNYTASFKDKK